MKIRITEDRRLLVFPEGHEFRAFKRWLLEYGSVSDDFYDSTAQCYVLRNHNAKELENFGFKIERLNRREYARMVFESLRDGYDLEE